MTSFVRISEQIKMEVGCVELFLLLQAFDFLTTMAGLRFGAVEASPFVALLMRWGPVAGVAVSKLLAVGLCGLCLWSGRRRLVRWINCWYAGLVVWNLCIIMAVRA